MGSQIRILSISDLSSNALFKVGKDFLSSDEIRNEYQQLIADNIYDSMQTLIDDLKLNSASKEAKNAAISRLLVEAIQKDGRYGADILRACSLENGDFVVPLNDPIHSNRIQQLLNSVIKSRINKQKIAGGPVVQASVFGFADDLKIVWKDKDGSILLDKNNFDKNNNLEGYTYEQYIKDNQDSIAYFETYMPIYDSDLEKALRKKDGSLMEPDEALKAGIIDEDMLKAISYRIPTEDKYSMFPLRIKGFVPKAAGEVIILPKEITLLSGSDFDIDKMYIMLHAFTSDKNGKFHTIKYNRSDATRDSRNNRILDIQYSILTNKDTMDKSFNPGSFDVQKKSARIITILKSTGYKYNYDTLSKMTLDELTDILNKQNTENIIYSTTQVHFHKQNMTAGKLIGIFANNNTSHAFLSMQDIKFKINKDNNFIFNGIDVSKNLNGKLDNQDSINGTKISKLIAGFLAASVDAVKDPVLNFMNLNTFTTNAAMVLARLGFDSDSIGLLLTQPIIEKVTREYQRKSNEGFVTANDIIDTELLNLSAKNTGISIDSLDKGLQYRDINNEELVRGLQDKVDNTVFQTEVLLLFKRLLNMGQDLNTLTFLTKFNSMSNAVGPTIADNLVLEDKYNRFISRMDSTNPPFNSEASTIIESSDILKAFFKTTIGNTSVTKRIFADYFPHYTERFQEVLSLLSTTMTSNLDAKLINTVLNDYIAFKLTSDYGDNKPVFNGDFASRYYYIHDFIKDFSTKTANITDNDLLKVLSINPVKDRCPVPTLIAKTGGYSTDVQEKVKDAWSNLVKKEETKQLGLDIFKYCFYRTGFAFSPTTPIHLASTDVKYSLPGYINAIRDVEYMDDYISAEQFLKQFRRNHANNSKLVPEYIPTAEIKVSKKGINITFSGDNTKSLKGLVVNTNVKDIVFFPIIKIDKKLYELQNYNVSLYTASYKEISSLGNNNNFIELSATEETPLSAIPTRIMDDKATDNSPVTDKNEFNISEDINNRRISTTDITNLLTESFNIDEIKELVGVSEPERADTFIRIAKKYFDKSISEEVVREKLNYVIQSLNLCK